MQSDIPMGTPLLLVWGCVLILVLLISIVPINPNICPFGYPILLLPLSPSPRTGYRSLLLPPCRTPTPPPRHPPTFN